MAECRILNNGMKMPLIGMGTFGSDHYTNAQITEAVAGGIRAGWRMFDCASVYGNEAEIGEVFKAAFDEGVVSRDELFITSKVWNDKHGKGEITASCERSVKDLKCGAVDIYFVHWPFPNYHAPGCSVDSRSADSRPFFIDEFMEVWREMEGLVDKGLARAIGVSNMTIPKLEAFLPQCRIKPAAIELELHPCFAQRELFDYVMARHIQPIGFCPVGSPARPERDRMPEDVADVDTPAVRAVAEKYGIHPVEVCLRWAITRGAVPIPFSTSPSHYKANLAAASKPPFNAIDMALLENADCDCRLVKGQVFLWKGASDWRALWDEDGVINGWDC